jgi:hypothetical protein
MENTNKDGDVEWTWLVPSDHPTRKPGFQIEMKHITVFFKILKQDNRSRSNMNDLQSALHEGLTALGYLERAVPITANKQDYHYSCTSKGLAAFLSRYSATNTIVATEGYLAELNKPPRMTDIHLESLLFLIEKGPVDDGDVPSKSTRDDLVTWGYAARIRVKDQDGYNAATHYGRHAFCEFYGVETMNEAYERRLMANVKKRLERSPDGK